MKHRYTVHFRAGTANTPPGDRAVECSDLDEAFILLRNVNYAAHHLSGRRVFKSQSMIDLIKATLEKLVGPLHQMPYISEGRIRVQSAAT